MTSPDDAPLDGPRDGSTDGPSKGTPDGPVEPGLPGPWGDASFDEEAAWRLIVENYGASPAIDGTSPDVAPTSPSDAPPPSRPVDPLAPPADAGPPARPAGAHDPFDRSYLDAEQAELEAQAGSEAPAEAGSHDRRRTDDNEHFVPPEPPPVPRGTPARRLAWLGLFAPPVLMVLAVVFGLAFPSWLAMLLVAGFVGGFVFLVLTMPRDGDDGRGDGAVV